MHRSGSSTGPQGGPTPGAATVLRRRGESRAGGKSSGFAPTGAWFFVLLVAALLFVVGVARSEPAAAISGGFFLVVLVLFAVSNTLAFIVVSRRLSRGGGFHLSPRISAADEGETRILALTVDPEARSLTILSPLLSYRLSTDLSFAGRTISANIRLRRHLESDELRVSCAQRGWYTGPNFTLRITDLLGFTQTQIVSPEVRELVVRPVTQATTLRLPRARQGERTVRSERRRRGEELLEVRSYVPGDDVRRIHWKLLAHAGRLMVRVEEQIPPPQARCRFVLCGDTTLTPGDRAAYGDRLASVFLAHFDGARAQDVVAEWVIPPPPGGSGRGGGSHVGGTSHGGTAPGGASPGAMPPAGASPGGSGRRGFEREALRDGLAAFLPGGPPGDASSAAPPDETPTIVVAPPDSPSAARLVSRLRRRARVYIVLPPGMDRVREARIAKVKAAFLQHPRRPAAPRPKERDAVQGAAERDIVAFRHAGASHVEVV